MSFLRQNYKFFVGGGTQLKVKKGHFFTGDPSLLYSKSANFHIYHFGIKMMYRSFQTFVLTPPIDRYS